MQKLIETTAPPGLEEYLENQAKIVLAELRAARELATRTGHDPGDITAPYIELLNKLYILEE